MQTVFSPRHHRHGGQVELIPGALVPAYEAPERAEAVLAAVAAAELGPVVAPLPQTLETALRVHRADYLDFLARAWSLWVAEGRAGPATPFVWPGPGLRTDAAPEHVDGLLGFYSFDGGASFVAGTWEAVRAAHDVALTAAELVAEGAPAAFALCRPPGHHAGPRAAGGYCYLNNAAVAAERLRERGAARVAILDVDYHHGNGTQAIFYARGDVLVASVHADPAADYPYFLGRAEERGVGEGEGCNLNLPLPLGADWPVWSAALDAACAAAERFGPDALVVSLGVDTYHGDPIGRFRLETDDFPRLGARLRRLARPTLFVLEGGYAADALGPNVVGALAGFEDG